MDDVDYSSRPDITPPIDAADVAISRPQAECPMVQLLSTLTGKWALPILYRLILFAGPVRFGELQRSIKGITQKELTKHLRHFEALELVTRTVYPEVPPRVEYHITDYGKTLETPLAELAHWSAAFGAPLFAARQRLLLAALPAADDCR